MGDWEFLVKDPLDGRTYYVRGGKHQGRLLRRLRNSAFLSARVRFPTTKTMAVETYSLQFVGNLSAVDQLRFKLMVNQAEIELRVKSLQI